MEELVVGGGSGRWTQIPQTQSSSRSNPATPSNPDSSHLFLSPQQHHHSSFNPPPQQPHHHLYHSQPPPPPLTQRLHQQSLASHFHLQHLVENLAEVVENGTRDQQSDALVSELSNQFDKCQQLLKSIAGSISSKSMTVEQQKRILEEDEQLLAQRRDLISKYRSSVDEIVNPET